MKKLIIALIIVIILLGSLCLFLFTMPGGEVEINSLEISCKCVSENKEKCTSVNVCTDETNSCLNLLMIGWCDQEDVFNVTGKYIERDKHQDIIYQPKDCCTINIVPYPIGCKDDENV